MVCHPPDDVGTCGENLERARDMGKNFPPSRDLGYSQDLGRSQMEII